MTKDMNLRDTGIVLSWLSGLLAALMSSLAGLWGKTGLASPVWGRCSAAEFDGMFFYHVSWVLACSDLYGNPVDYD